MVEACNLITVKITGRVEVQIDKGGPWGPVCGDGWGVREAMVSKTLPKCEMSRQLSQKTRN